MNHKEIGRQRGREAAARFKELKLHEVMEFEFARNLALFPTLGKDYDFARAVVAWDHRRLQATPDTNRFPEVKNIVDEVFGEREGFLESSGLSEVHCAYHYSFFHLIWKHINSHHAARYDLESARLQCTDVFFPDGCEGITSSDNRDDILYPHNEASVVNFRPAPPPQNPAPRWLRGGVSSLILMDEEPEEIFPYDPHPYLPSECRKNIKDIIAWMYERRDFLFPGNQIWADENLNAVAIEKSNRRIGVRFPTHNGAVCITAGGYLDPELSAFKQERLKRVAEAIGVTPENCFDVIFSNACDARYRRLLELTNAEASRPGGATLWGAFNIVADTAVPFPERICLAGEKLEPEREPNANWTLMQQATVQSGPNRRVLFRSVQSYSNPRPIYEETPKLLLSEGVAMRPEWQRDIDDGKCKLA
jgi:hypothetical protein